MNNDISINDVLNHRLKQLHNEFDSVRDVLITYELPFITGNASPTLVQLERAERSLNRLIMIRASIEELENLTKS